MGNDSIIAHQDIEPSREWQAEIEAALASMHILVALVEPGFRESSWTDQEVGFALGREVEVIPLLAGQIPHGFIAKIQGIQVKGRKPAPVAEELVQLLLRKPRYRTTLLQGVAATLATSNNFAQEDRIRSLNTLISEAEMKDLLEGSALSEWSRTRLSDISERVGAFKQAATPTQPDDDIPF